MQSSAVRKAAVLLFICFYGIVSADSSFGEEASGDHESWIKTVYNEDNGLPTGEANVVLQTSDGYIWIGSYGGLIRYDGTSFKNYSTEENALESSSIRALHEGKDGALYVGTNDKGVYIYKNGEFKHADYDGSDEAFYSVRCFTEDKNGSVLVGTTSGIGMIVQENGSEPMLAALSDTAGYVVYDMSCDSNGVIWACSDDGAVLLVRDGRLFTVAESELWLGADCYSLLAASDGCIYLGSSASEVAKVKLKDDTYAASSYESKSISTDELHTVNKLYEDSKGNVWVLADNGMGKIENGGSLTVPSAMKNMTALSNMIEDYEGNLWIASTRTAISYFSQGKYSNFNYLGELDGVTVNAVERYGGKSYLGTDQGLILLDEGFNRIENELTAELSNKRVRHIMAAKDGKLWFSVYGDGLAVYDAADGSVTYYTDEDGLLGNQVRLTLELSDGSVAVAGSSGIDILKDGKVLRSYGSNELAYPFILCLSELPDGTLLAGSDGTGFYAIKGSEVKQFYKDAGLESGVVMRMEVDNDLNTVWISAGNGLYCISQDSLNEQGRASKISFNSGAGSIFDIKSFGDDIWLMKSNGPVVVNKKELYENKAVKSQTLSKEYGLTGTLVANSWNYVSEDGAFWLCTNNGISVIETGNIPVNGVAPKGTVTQVIADGKVCESPSKLELPSSTKRITFDIAAMSYTLADKYVEYYLEGFDEEAVRCNISEVPSISYTNLRGGDYVFHMTVFNEDGIKGESCTVSIHKAYRLWELGWFWALMVLLLAAAIAIVFRVVYQVKINRLKKRQTEYRSIIEQSLHTFANAIDAKDKDTNGHSGRVAQYSKEIARRMNLSENEQETIYYMALLHDIGKIGIPDSILKKNGKLTNEEWEIVKSHPRIGGEILKEFTAIPGIADGAKYHHEFYNGKGYCEGLKGEEIPVLARIIAVADAFDAMCSKRYYHDGTTVEHAREEIEKCSGEQFDPEAAKCMLEMIDEGFVNKVIS